MMMIFTQNCDSRNAKLHLAHQGGGPVVSTLLLVNSACGINSKDTLFCKTMKLMRAEILLSDILQCRI